MKTHVNFETKVRKEVPLLLDLKPGTVFRFVFSIEPSSNTLLMRTMGSNIDVEGVRRPYAVNLTTGEVSHYSNVAVEPFADAQINVDSVIDSYHRN